MSLSKTLGATAYTVPTNNETGWGTQVTNLLGDLVDHANLVTGTPWINVKSSAYGAKGDGVTDDTAAIAAAVTAAASGGTIYFPDGIYLTTAAFVIPSNVRILGSGDATIKQGTTNINLLNLSDSVDVEIAGLIFDGNSLGSSTTNVNIGVFSLDTTTKEKRCRVHHCLFKDFYAWAINFQGPAASVYSEDLNIHDNELYSMTDEGISVYYMKRVAIQGNLIYAHAKEGIKATTTTDISIRGNKIYALATGATDGPLINVGTDCSKVVIDGNICYQGNKGIGVEKRVTEVTITGNHCYSQGQEGIGVASGAGDVVAMDNIVIANNVVKDSGYMNIQVVGISGLYAGRTTITGNVCNGAGSGGTYPNINVYRCDNSIVANNDCTTSTKQNIVVSTGTSAVVSGNRVSLANQDGIQVATMTRAVVIGNVVEKPNRLNTSYGGIQIDSTVTTCEANWNLCHDSDGYMDYEVRNQATTPDAINIQANRLASTFQAVAGAGGTVNVDFASGYNIRLTMTADTTLTFSNPRDGERYLFVIVQDGTGRTITWPATVKWRGAAAPTLSTASQTHVVSMMYDSTGAIYLAEYGTNFA